MSRLELTCGLQTSPSANADSLTPQESTNQESGTVGADWAGLSCPGSSVVAEIRHDDSELAPLMKGPAPLQSENTQNNQDTEFPSVNEDEV